MKAFLALAATLAGAGLLVLGVTLLSVPAGLILSGVLLATYGLVGVNIGEPE